MPPRTNDSIDLELEREIDRLFRLPLDGFVAARNELAATLRKSGRGEDAERIRELPKPSVTAWAVNQVWWTDRRTFERMLDAGEHLRDQQRASLKGKAVNLRDAVEARQRAIGEVVSRAAAIMGGDDGISAPMQQRIAATCDVLATSDVPEGTVLGRLVQDLQPAGFAALTGFLPQLPGRAARETRGPKEAATVTPFRAREPSDAGAGARAGETARQKEETALRARAAALAQAQDALAEAEAALRDADRELAARRTAQEKSERAYAATQARLADLERQLGEARTDEANARASASEARRQTASVENSRARAATAVDRARKRLEALEED
jgi:hypothetical protein